MDELDRTSSVDVMYVAEMDPPTADGAQVYDIGDDVINSSLNKQPNKEKIGPTTGKAHTFTFKKLKDEKYSVVIKTLVNGRTIVRVSISKSLPFFTKLIWITSEYKGSRRLH